MGPIHRKSLHSGTKCIKNCLCWWTFAQWDQIHKKFAQWHQFIKCLVGVQLHSGTKLKSAFCKKLDFFHCTVEPNALKMPYVGEQLHSGTKFIKSLHSGTKCIRNALCWWIIAQWDQIFKKSLHSGTKLIFSNLCNCSLI